MPSLQLVWGETQAQLLDWQVMPPLHACEQLPQWLSSDARFAHEPLQSIVDAGHPDAHANVLPEGLHRGVLPLHAPVHDPQWLGLERSVSQPSPGFVEQCAYPGRHVNAQAPALHARPPAATWASCVQSFVHDPHVRRSVVEAHPCVHRSCAEVHPPGESPAPPLSETVGGASSGASVP